MFPEERNDTTRQIWKRSGAKAPNVLPMIVVSVVAANKAAPEERLQSVQDLHTPLSLDDRESRLNLPTDTTRSVPEDRNTEAAFAVNEADDPLRESWPFLLIVRTGRIITINACTLGTGCDTDEYRRILGVSSK